MARRNNMPLLLQEDISLLEELESSVGEERLAFGSTVNLFWRTVGSLAQMADGYDDQQQYQFARCVTQAVLASYWAAKQRTHGAALAFIAFDDSLSGPGALNDVQTMLARGLGKIAAQQDTVLAGYCIGEVYTKLLPDEYRSKFGVYYTPPALTRRLLAMVSSTGMDWRAARVLDPACGGGAFLAPVALEMRHRLAEEPPIDILRHIKDHLCGYEIDPFAAWISQTLLEASLYDLCCAAGYRIKNVVLIQDSLVDSGGFGQFDLVIGNPPYGRVSLSEEMRERYQRSIYGHANLYGLFMDLAVRLTRAGGLVAFVTPTSFLGGNYFRRLRSLMLSVAPPVAIDFVAARKGVFTDVLQETLLAIYRHDARPMPAAVNVVSLLTESDIDVTSTGVFAAPRDKFAPWLIPRRSDQVDLIERLRLMPHRLRDYGYRVSTGPLVWNRHKQQLTDKRSAGAYPVIWAESIAGDGRFVYRTDKRNHKRFIRIDHGDDWLLERRACVLVQRTTAKEQRRRLIAAELPAQFVTEHEAVSIENHINMIRPIEPGPKVPLSVLVALLNSDTVDSAFRCISGSVAVSATELEALPLPPPDRLDDITRQLAAGEPKSTIESAISQLFYEEACHVA